MPQEHQRYGQERALEEAELLRKKVESGEALSYPEAEQQLTEEQEYSKAIDEKIESDPDLKRVVESFGGLYQEALEKRHLVEKAGMRSYKEEVKFHQEHNRPLRKEFAERLKFGRLEAYDDAIRCLSPDYYLKERISVNGAAAKSLGRIVEASHMGNKYFYNSGQAFDLKQAIEKQGFHEPSGADIYFFSGNMPLGSEDYENDPFIKKFFEMRARITELQEQSKDPQELVSAVHREFPTLYEQFATSSRSEREKLQHFNADELKDYFVSESINAFRHGMVAFRGNMPEDPVLDELYQHLFTKLHQLLPTK